MSAKSEGQSRWRLEKESILPLLIAIGAYIGLEALFVLLNLPSQTYFYVIFAIFPAVAIPIVAGAKYGPIVGFLAGFGGKLLADAIIYGGIWIFWPIGFGLMGFIPGLTYHKYYRGKYAEGGNLVRLSLFALLAAFIGTAFPTLMSIFVDKLGIFLPIISSFLPLFIIAAFNGVIIAPIIARSIDFLENKYNPIETSEIPSVKSSNVSQVGLVMASFSFLIAFGLFILSSSSSGEMGASCAGTVPFGHEVLGNLRIALDLGMYIFLVIGATISMVLLIKWLIMKRQKNIP